VIAGGRSAGAQVACRTAATEWIDRRLIDLISGRQ
jgi:hypothetical protein